MAGVRNCYELLNECKCSSMSFFFRIPVFVLPQLPQDPNESLASWFSMAEGMFADLRDTLERAHSDRIKRLVEMPRKASQILWWPFTQHSLVKEGSIAVIDSRCGENFSIFKVCQIDSEPRFICLYDKMQ